MLAAQGNPGHRCSGCQATLHHQLLILTPPIWTSQVQLLPRLLVLLQLPELLLLLLLLTQAAPGHTAAAGVTAVPAGRQRRSGCRHLGWQPQIMAPSQATISTGTTASLVSLSLVARDHATLLPRPQLAAVCSCCWRSPGTAPTDALQPSPAMMAASHSTVPCRVRLEPRPALVTAASCSSTQPPAATAVAGVDRAAAVTVLADSHC